MNPLDPLADISPWEWPPEASELVVAALRSPDPAVRLEAASSAWHAMSDEVAEALLHTLRDRDHEVAAAAAMALGPTLEEHDGQELSVDPTYGYAKTSRAMLDQIVVELEIAWTDSSLPDAVRCRVLEAASRAPEAWTEQAVREKLADPDPDWRSTAVFCCGFLAGFEDDIFAALADSDLAVQLEAVRAAGAREITEAVPILLTIADDEGADRALRLVAVEALGNIPSEEAWELLERLLADDDEELAEVAEAALGELALAQSLEGFGRDAFDDEDWN